MIHSIRIQQEVIDEKKAFSYWKAKADGHDLEGMAQTARCYEKGIGTVANPARAVKLYQKLFNILSDLSQAYEGNALRERYYPLAAYRLARLKEKIDPEFSLIFYRTAAANGLGKGYVRAAAVAKTLRQD